MGASVAFDLQAISRKIDTLDAAGPLSRNLQSALWLSLAMNSMLSDIKMDPGTGVARTAGTYPRSEEWAVADQLVYEGHIDDALLALKDVVASLKALTKTT